MASTALQLGSFRFDVTPPAGHARCGGLITPVRQVEDTLEAIGFVLHGAGDPIVLCTIDWTGLCNSAFHQWRDALADAAGTSIDRVTVHCVHQHDAPLVCLDAQQRVANEGGPPALGTRLKFTSRSRNMKPQSPHGNRKGAWP